MCVCVSRHLCSPSVRPNAQRGSVWHTTMLAPGSDVLEHVYASGKARVTMAASSARSRMVQGSCTGFDGVHDHRACVKNKGGKLCSTLPRHSLELIRLGRERVCGHLGSLGRDTAGSLDQG